MAPCTPPRPSFQKAAFLTSTALPLGPATFSKSSATSTNSVSARRAPQCSDPSPDPGRSSTPILRRLLSVAAAAALPVLASTLAALPASARDKKGSVITMTDQVPNFTLPSQERAVRLAAEGPSLVTRVITLAKRVLPPVALLAIAVWAVKKVLQKAQERQLRDFQVQLSSFSSMLDLDAADRPQSATEASVLESATKAREILKNSARRQKVRSGGSDGDDAEEDLSAKVRLDLFRAGGSGSTSAAAGTATEKDEAESGVGAASDAEPTSPLERAFADCVGKAGSGDDEARKAAAADLVKARQDAELDEAVFQKAFEDYVSRVVSVQIDRSGAKLDADDRDMMRNLHNLSATMSAVRTLLPDATLRYVGAFGNNESMREEVYRRYAVYCLSSEERAKNEQQTLEEMQRVLEVSDARAQTINTEIAKGMFQVAVSAAMADGSLSDADREALETVRESFGSFLDGNSADSILSEVAVMRAMYALQQLLQEQGVSADDVKELRKMCSDLGVDIDEMLQNADALGEALGPEAKNFVESLRGVLMKSTEEEGASSSTSSA